MFLSSIFSNVIFLILTLSIALVNYVFKAIGLFTMARKTHPSNAWMAFVPVANSYLLGKLAGGTNIFITRIKNTALMLFLAHLTQFMLKLAFNILLYMPYIKDIIAGEYTLLQFLKQGVEAESGLSTGLNIISSFYNFANLAYIVLFVSALFAIFRKYEPERSMMYAIISVLFNVEGIFIFLIRNNKEINYNEYIKEKYERYRTQDPYNPYNRGPYSGQAPYQPPRKPQNPFEEFEENKTENKNEEIFPGFGEDNSNFDPYADKESNKEEDKKDDDFFK